MDIEQEELRAAVSTQPNITMKLREEIEKARMEIEDVRSQNRELSWKIVVLERQVKLEFDYYGTTAPRGKLCHCWSCGYSHPLRNNPTFPRY